MGDREPSCFLTEKIAGKKVFLVRLINPGVVNDGTRAGKKPSVSSSSLSFGTAVNRGGSPEHKRRNDKTKPHSMVDISQLPPVPSSVVGRSVSVADLLLARKLVKPLELSEVTMILEAYDVGEKTWKSLCQYSST